MSPTKKTVVKRNTTQQVNKGKPICSGRTLRSSSIVTPTSKNAKKDNKLQSEESTSSKNKVSKLQYPTTYVGIPYSLRVYLCIWVLNVICSMRRVLEKINFLEIFQRGLIRTNCLLKIRILKIVIGR
jgi:hypothetical protein